MMQVTGNKLPETQAKETILSIQVSLNGLSFCTYHETRNPDAKTRQAQKPKRKIVESGTFKTESENLPLNGTPYGAFDASLWEGMEKYLREQPWIRDAFREVNILFDTDKIVFYPDSEELSTESLVKSAGWRTGSNERVVTLPVGEGIVGAMQVPDTFIRLFENLFVEPLFTHPQAYGYMSGTPDGLNTILTGSIAHLRLIKNNKTRFLNSYVYTNLTEVLFLINQVDEVYGLNNETVRLIGQDAEKALPICRPYLKNLSLIAPLSKNTADHEFWYLSGI